MRALSVRSDREDDVKKPAAAIRLVAFDMDGILVDAVSSWGAVHRALGTDNRAAIAAYLNGAIDDRQFILSDVALWRRAAPAFGRRDLEAILAGVRRMPGLLEATAALREAGARCVIVSGGLATLAAMVAHEAKLDGFRANDVVFGKDGRLADEAVVDVPLRDKSGVLEAFQREAGVLPAATASVGDSVFDAGLFHRSALSVAFNPIDEAAGRAATHLVRGADLRQAVRPILESMRESR
jgi:HAD superfamily PSPase-like hydrolase